MLKLGTRPRPRELGFAAPVGRPRLRPTSVETPTLPPASAAPAAPAPAAPAAPAEGAQAAPAPEPEEPDNGVVKLSFFEKLKNFFRSIVEFFRNLFG